MTAPRQPGGWWIDCSPGSGRGPRGAGQPGHSPEAAPWTAMPLRSHGLAGALSVLGRLASALPMALPQGHTGLAPWTGPEGRLAKLPQRLTSPVPWGLGPWPESPHLCCVLLAATPLPGNIICAPPPATPRAVPCRKTRR